MTIEHWQVAVALICTPGAVVIVLLYAMRDRKQSEDGKQSTVDRIAAAAYKLGADNTVELVKHLHHRLDEDHKKRE